MLKLTEPDLPISFLSGEACHSRPCTFTRERWCVWSLGVFAGTSGGMTCRLDARHRDLFARARWLAGKQGKVNREGGINGLPPPREGSVCLFTINRSIRRSTRNTANPTLRPSNDLHRLTPQHNPLASQICLSTSTTSPSPGLSRPRRAKSPSPTLSTANLTHVARRRARRRR